jgi:cell division protein FtsL
MRGLSEMRKSLQKLKKVHIVLIMGVMIVLGLLIGPLFENLKMATIQRQIESISSKLSQDDSNQLKPASYYNETNIYNVMHKMANTKIVA